MNIEIDWKKFENPDESPEYQTKDICLDAVKRDGLALRFVNIQTEEICIEAVKQDWYSLQYVKNQTEDMCLEAVKRNGLALKFVKNQTEDICLEALRNKWYKNVYNRINIPIEGNFLKEINKMKLIKGPLL